MEIPYFEFNVENNIFSEKYIQIKSKKKNVIYLFTFVVAFVSKIIFGKIKILENSVNNGHSVFWIKRRI